MNPPKRAIEYYKVGSEGDKWTVMRISDEQLICYCRDQREAYRLAEDLNKDCEQDPKHHKN